MRFLKLILTVVFFFGVALAAKGVEAQEEDLTIESHFIAPPTSLLNIAELGNYSLQTPFFAERRRSRREEEYRRNRIWGIALAAGGGALLLGSIISLCFSEDCVGGEESCYYGHCETEPEVCGTNGAAVAFGVIFLAGAIAAGIFSYLKFRAASRLQRRRGRRSLLDNFSIAYTGSSEEVSLPSGI